MISFFIQNPPGTAKLHANSCNIEIPPSQQLRHEFIVNLDTYEQEITYKGCLLLYAVTNGAKVPWEFQLEAMPFWLARTL
jgi:hypothetical protein